MRQLKGYGLKTILATTSSFAESSPDIMERLTDAGLHIIQNPFRRQLKEDELNHLLKVNEPVGMLAGTEIIGRETIKEAARYLRVVSRVGVGWDNVDLKAAEEMGILVYRTPEVLTDAVAELTIGLILSGLRLIPSHDRLVRQGKWKKEMGRLLRKKTVGIIGFGSIGQRVGELVKAFGAQVIYYDPRQVNVSWAQPMTLVDLLNTSEIISIHAGGKERILGTSEFEKIRSENVLLVNAARGSLIDEKCLYESLKEGRITFACLDVFEQEPYDGPLANLDNVVLTPHIGSYAREARHLMEQQAVENLLDGLNVKGMLR